MRPSRTGGKVIYQTQAPNANPVLNLVGENSFVLTNFTGSKTFNLYQGPTQTGSFEEVDTQTGTSPLVFNGDSDDAWFFADILPGLTHPTAGSSNVLQDNR